jgi:hypothetical protein
MGSNSSVLATQDPDAEEREQMETPIFEKYDHLLHGSSRKKRYCGSWEQITLFFFK